MSAEGVTEYRLVVDSEPKKRPSKINPKIVACMPALNEQKSIAAVIVQVKKFADEVIVCDDGSSDLTGEIAESLGATVIKHERNLGYGASISDLLNEALKRDADVVVTLDADGQHDPRFLPSLAAPIFEGSADLVIGSRFLGSSSRVPGYRQIGIKALTDVSNILAKLNITDAQSGYRAYSGAILPRVAPAEYDMGASTEILAKASDAGLRVTEIPIEIVYKVGRSSTQNPFYQGVSVLLSTFKHYSIRHPLWVYGVPGFVAMVLAFVFGFWALDIFSQTRALSTNIVLISMGAGLFGMMLLTTAIILYVLVSLIRELKSK